jgi:hypothetical protein
MNRLQNAQKLLDESLAALESAVAHYQQTAQNHPASAPAECHVDASTSNPALDLASLASDVAAIESDLDDAIKLIAKLNNVPASGGAA